MVLKKTIAALKLDLDKDHNNISKDRLFFHDLINLTHGLSLFLNQKKLQKNALNSNELELVIKEIKTLQSLAKDHFEFSHKNLVDTPQWVAFGLVLANLEHLVNVYFPAQTIKWVVENKAHDSTRFYFPLFYRAANNLIKNMSEARSENIGIKISVNEHKIYLETSNEIKPSQKSLEMIILDETKKRVHGVGLDSIDHMAHEFGGEFQFEIQQGKWINKLVLPSQESFFKSKKKAS